MGRNKRVRHGWAAGTRGILPAKPVERQIDPAMGERSRIRALVWAGRGWASVLRRQTAAGGQTAMGGRGRAGSAPTETLWWEEDPSHRTGASGPPQLATTVLTGEAHGPFREGPKPPQKTQTSTPPGKDHLPAKPHTDHVS